MTPILPLTPMAAGALLAAFALGLIAYTAYDRREYRTFKALTQTRDRQRHYRKWVLVSFVLFGLSSLSLLWLFGDLPAVLEIPAVLRGPFSAWIGEAKGALGHGALWLFLGGVAGGLVGGAAIAVLLRRRSPAKKPAIIGDVESLLPRNRAEGAWATLLSVNAGLSEEIFFRLLLPLLVTALTGDALTGFLGAAAAFGLVHAYQGVWGVVATGVMGLVFSAIYVLTGSLFVVIALHALVDLRALVLAPALDALFTRRRPA